MYTKEAAGRLYINLRFHKPRLKLISKFKKKTVDLYIL